MRPSAPRFPEQELRRCDSGTSLQNDGAPTASAAAMPTCSALEPCATSTIGRSLRTPHPGQHRKGKSPLQATHEVRPDRSSRKHRRREIQECRHDDAGHYGRTNRSRIVPSPVVRVARQDSRAPRQVPLSPPTGIVRQSDRTSVAPHSQVATFPIWPRCAPAPQIRGSNGPKAPACSNRDPSASPSRCRSTASA